MADALQKTILFVEDEFIFARAGALIVQSFGYQVIYASNGPQAVALAASHPEIDLVLMDIELGPEMSGAQAAQEILRQRELPVVFLTAHEERSVLEKVRGITRYGYVIKGSGNAALQIALEMAFDLFTALQQVRKSEALFRTIFNQSPIGIELYDAAGRLVSANPACLEIFGVLNPQEIQGFRLYEDPNMSDENKELLRQGHTVHYQVAFDFERVRAQHLYRTSREGIIWLDVLITPLEGHEAGINGYLVHVQDFSARKRPTVSIFGSGKSQVISER